MSIEYIDPCSHSLFTLVKNRVSNIPPNDFQTYAIMVLAILCKSAGIWKEDIAMVISSAATQYSLPQDERKRVHDVLKVYVKSIDVVRPAAVSSADVLSEDEVNPPSLVNSSRDGYMIKNKRVTMEERHRENYIGSPQKYFIENDYLQIFPQPDRPYQLIMECYVAVKERSGALPRMLLDNYLQIMMKGIIYYHLYDLKNKVPDKRQAHMEQDPALIQAQRDWETSLSSIINQHKMQDIMHEASDANWTTFG